MKKLTVFYLLYAPTEKMVLRFWKSIKLFKYLIDLTVIYSISDELREKIKEGKSFDYVSFFKSRDITTIEDKGIRNQKILNNFSKIKTKYLFVIDADDQILRLKMLSLLIRHYKKGVDLIRFENAYEFDFQSNKIIKQNNVKSLLSVTTPLSVTTTIYTKEVLHKVKADFEEMLEKFGYDKWPRFACISDWLFNGLALLNSTKIKKVGKSPYLYSKNETDDTKHYRDEVARTFSTGLEHRWWSIAHYEMLQYIYILLLDNNFFTREEVSLAIDHNFSHRFNRLENDKDQFLRTINSIFFDKLDLPKSRKLINDYETNKFRDN